jgi:hypothetical protein
MVLESLFVAGRTVGHLYSRVLSPAMTTISRRPRYDGGYAWLQLRRTIMTEIHRCDGPSRASHGTNFLLPKAHKFTGKERDAESGTGRNLGTKPRDRRDVFQFFLSRCRRGETAGTPQVFAAWVCFPFSWERREQRGGKTGRSRNYLSPHRFTKLLNSRQPPQSIPLPRLTFE